MKISEAIKWSYSPYVSKSFRYDDEEIVLSKCPRCNEKAKLVFSYQQDGNCTYNTAYIKCTNCKIRTEARTIDGYYGDESKINDVIKDWNY